MNDVITATSTEPESYIRINITQNTKGFTYETTVSYRWNPDEECGSSHLHTLLVQSRELALAEIERRRAGLDG